MRRAVVVVGLIALLALAPVVAVASQPDGTATTPTTTTDNSNRTVTPWDIATPTATDSPTPTTTDRNQESDKSTVARQSVIGPSGSEIQLTRQFLKSDGPRQANSPDSVRMGRQRAFWAVYWPANNPFADVGSPDGGDFLPPGHTVGRNEIYLRTWAYRDLETTVHVVYWERGTRGTNGSERAISENVTHVTHEVTFDRGRPTVKIPLKQHDTPVNAKLWIEGQGFAQWTFSHHSIATTQSVQIDSAGDYLSSVITDFLIWILLGGFLSGVVVKKALERAGTGPGYGYLPWIIGLTAITGLGVALSYESLADLVVNARIVLAGYVVAVFAVILLETYQENTSRALFLRPTLDHTESPTGEDAYDVVDAEARSETIVRSSDGKVSVVRRGVLPFLARVFGRSARLENVEQLRTRIPLRDSGWDEMFISDPEADQLIDFEPPSWTLSAPPLTKATAPRYLAIGGLLAVAAAAWYVGSLNGPVIAGGVAAVLLVWLASPVDGSARVDPAPVHIRSAFGSMIGLSEDIDNAKRFSELRDKLDQERITKQRDVDRQVAQHDDTLLSGMLDPDGNIPAAESEDDHDPNTEDPDNDRNTPGFPDETGTGAGGDDD
jgi:hypothetical protein